MEIFFAFLNTFALFASENASEMTTGQRILLTLGIIVGAFIACVVIAGLVILVRAMIQAGINLKKQNASGELSDETSPKTAQNASDDNNLSDKCAENEQTQDKNDGNVD